MFLFTPDEKEISVHHCCLFRIHNPVLDFLFIQRNTTKESHCCTELLGIVNLIIKVCSKIQDWGVKTFPCNYSRKCLPLKNMIITRKTCEQQIYFRSFWDALSIWASYNVFSTKINAFRVSSTLTRYSDLNDQPGNSRLLPPGWYTLFQECPLSYRRE